MLEGAVWAWMDGRTQVYEAKGGREEGRKGGREGEREGGKELN